MSLTNIVEENFCGLIHQGNLYAAVLVDRFLSFFSVIL